MTWKDVTDEEQKWLTRLSHQVIGFYCTICGWKLDPRLDGTYSTMEMHVLGHVRKRGTEFVLGAGVGGVSLQEEEGGNEILDEVEE